MIRKKKRSFLRIKPYEEEKDTLNNFETKKKKNKNKKIKFSFFTKKQKISHIFKTNNIAYIIGIIIFFLLLFIGTFVIKKGKKIFFKEKNPEFLIREEITNPEIIEQKNSELEKVKLYIKNNMNKNLIDFSKTIQNPKISIVIPVNNNGNNLKSTLLSIQNQDFEDVEIIIVDDCSTDDSINIIKEFKKKDSRIILLQNEEKKGELFTKIIGVSNAKGKYVMFLENKDIYLQTDAFSTIYREAESNNLDILGFSAIINWQDNDKIDYSYKNEYIHHFYKTSIISKPIISQKMYYFDRIGEIHRAGDVIFNYCFKTDIFKKRIINQKEDEIYLKRVMNYNEDLFLFFLLTRVSNNLMHIQRIFYYSVKRKEFQNNNQACLDYLFYSEFLLNKTNNDNMDKKIASYELDTWFLNTKCRTNEYIKSDAINTCKLFTQNKLIEDNIKKKIYLFMFENETSIAN